MSFWEAVRLAFDALRANRLRSALTMLGTVVAVVAIVAVVSITQGLNRYVSQQLLEVGSHVFTIDKFGDVVDMQTYYKAMRRRDLRRADAEYLRAALPSAEAVVPSLYRSADVAWGGREAEDVSIIGVGEGYGLLDDSYRVTSGRELVDEELRGGTRSVLLGSEVAEELFGPVDPVGRAVRVGGQSYWVAGVLAARGRVLGQSQDNRVILPITAFEKQWGSRRSVTINIRAASPELYEICQEEAATLLKIRRGLQPWEEPDFGLQTAEAFYEMYQRMTRLFYLGIIAIVGLSLVVGGIVMMNIMLVAVTERTREIGIRKAVGARRRDITLQFLVEACTLSGAGAAIGLVLGAAVAVLVGRASPLPTRLEPWSILLSLGMALAVGIVAGSYPAARAARLVPVTALSYEK